MDNKIKIINKDGLIAGYLIDNKVNININSYFSNYESNNLDEKIINLRRYLIDYGYIENNKIIKNYVFDDYKTAIECLTGKRESVENTFFTLENVLLKDYLNSINTLTKPDIDDKDCIVSSINTLEYELSEDEIKPCSVPNLIDVNEERYERNYVIAKQALIRNNYKCMINECHSTFITKQHVPYVEAHHLIPLSCQKDFNVSLDVEANIIPLCANCHRELHYGENREYLLKILFEKQKDKLKMYGIEINFDKLLSYYN